MKSALLTALRRIEIRDVPVPRPGPGELLIKVAAVGVCGSDVHYWEDGRIGDQVLVFPAVLGHESSGVVETAGPGTRILPGTRVMVEPAASCGHCPRCLSGRPNLCPDVKFLGTPPNPGILSQFHAVPEHCCLPIPDAMTLAEAALFEPLAVGLHAVHLARLEVGDHVAVLGCGPIGLSCAYAARLAGAATVRVTDPVPERAAFAEKWLGTAIMDPRAGIDPVRWIRDATGGHGADAVFECAGTQESLDQCCLAVRRGGKALLVGIPAGDRLSIPMHECRRRELAMLHVRRSNGESGAALRLWDEKRLDVKPLATHFFGIERSQAAFELVSLRADGVIRAIIWPNGAA